MAIRRFLVPYLIAVSVGLAAMNIGRIESPDARVQTSKWGSIGNGATDTIHNHLARVDADSYLVLDDEALATGEIDTLDGKYDLRYRPHIANTN